MPYFNVHWTTIGGARGKTTMDATDKLAARKAFNTYAAMDMDNAHGIPFEADLRKIIPLVSTPATPKQKLSRRYGFILGSIKGAQAQFVSSFPDLQVGQTNHKITRGISLVNSQFAKLQRDVRDLFKLAGLNVK